ncbi:sigma-70 family RNA polymerase sigma factor [Streptomyces sp. NPDC053493]|uniref:sigma-70 family RNA polymerase sigma factor n=1 Tax=Streptomyces sp. NPDC053493 TaxID=3365705 RepID=UPI0037D742E3
MTRPTDPELGAIVGERRRLTNLAYRLLGSLADAEDVVQETYARWYALSPRQQEAVESPGGWLTTVAGRICLDLLGSARVRRERYVGEWLPEPLPDRTQWISGRPLGGGGDASDPADPADRVTLDESVGMAFLVMLEAMTPAERVAFILHDVFRYPFADVAEIVGRTPAACRQLASSARRRIRTDAGGSRRDGRTGRRGRTGQAGQAGQAGGAGRTGLPGRTGGTAADTVRAFKLAWEARDIGALLGVLAPDVTATGDGGGVVSAALHPVRGAEPVARFFAARAAALPAVTLVECAVNGQPGLAALADGVTVSVMAFDVTDDGRIQRVWAVLNPEKLRPWAAG